MVPVVTPATSPDPGSRRAPALGAAHRAARRAGLRAAGLLAVLSLALAGCDSGNGKTEAPPAPPRPVLVAPVHYEEVVETRTFAATIKPRIESDLGFRVGGKVAERLVQVGDRVTKGQPLLRLDTTDLALQVDQAEAEVKAAETSQMQAVAEEARAIELQKKGWAAAATLDKARAAADEARGRLRRARRSLDLAQNSLEYATLEADADGAITATPVEPGQVVAAGQAAVRLARTAEVEALVALPETFVERARGARASLTLWSLPDRRYEVTLRELAPAADPATRTYAARYTIPHADDAVRLGMSATLALTAPNGIRAARLPLTAMFDHGDGPRVWVIDRDGHPVARPITIARYEDDDVLITGGVDEGQKVVTLGVEKLDPGLTVRPTETLAF
ncbi:putative Co/Zn/Cd efflux system membrane fusion protein [Rhodovulum sp. PH10]|uniref:efflux RND transporter periplasmic adaptor subunit n=1 Tax=Rhodovulum sp. PH10 TaxID=1187851 RepID=UPI00027C2959|nr:efflux RND transporter periplasmic adaptor subunit [Rhodovulum sp. PH10]EJW10729.1 putative Co/Zn/Cd efflux system membrane fusion protein [Rhodovulum sp. PH10]